MSRPIIDTPVSDETRAAICQGWVDYRASTELRGVGVDGSWDQAVADECDKELIDTVIRAFARQGRPFSANTIRPHVEGVRKCLISRRLIAAQDEGLIRYAGVTPSTLKSTKSARVNVYVPLRQTAEGIAS